MALTNSQYNSLIKEYDVRRSNALRIRKARLDEIRKRIPEYARLEDESTDIALSYSKRAINDPHTDLSGLDAALDDIATRQNELLKAHGISPDYLEPPYACPDCQDTGYIGHSKCHCFKKAAIRILCAGSNISELAATDNFDSLRDDLHEGEDKIHFDEAVKACRRFVDRFDADYENLMLVGTVGTGKSFLSSCIAHSLLESGHSVLYFAASDFFDLCAAYKFDRDHEQGDAQDTDTVFDLYRYIYSCDLLILDDLGTELTNSFVSTSLFNCLNARHNNHRSTLVSTNLELSDLHARYSDRIFSRLTGHYSILRLTGPDLRMKLRTANI